MEDTSLGPCITHCIYVCNAFARLSAFARGINDQLQSHLEVSSSCGPALSDCCACINTAFQSSIMQTDSQTLAGLRGMLASTASAGPSVLVCRITLLGAVVGYLPSHGKCSRHAADRLSKHSSLLKVPEKCPSERTSICWRPCSAS